jgi:hypothetical protein
MFPKILNSENSTCAKLQELARTKDFDAVLKVANHSDVTDGYDDLSSGFELAVQAMKVGGNVYILQLDEDGDEGSGVAFVGKAKDVRKLLNGLPDRGLYVGGAETPAIQRGE